MCHLFASQSPETYAYEARSVRLNGQSTSIRLEKVFWDLIEQMAAGEGVSVPAFLSTLHGESLLLWGEVPNFTSHLRCACLAALENGSGRRRENAPRGNGITPALASAP